MLALTTTLAAILSPAVRGHLFAPTEPGNGAVVGNFGEHVMQFSNMTSTMEAGFTQLRPITEIEDCKCGPSGQARDFEVYFGMGGTYGIGASEPIKTTRTFDANTLGNVVGRTICLTGRSSRRSVLYRARVR